MLIGLISSQKYKNCISAGIKELGQRLTYTNQLGVDFLQCINEVGKMNLGILIIELSVQVATDEEFVKGIREFRAKFDTKSEVRIIILAVDRQEGDITLAKIISKQVYDISNPRIQGMNYLLAKEEEFIKDSLIKLISQKKGSYFDVKNFEVDFERIDKVINEGAIYQKPIGNAVIAVAGSEKGVGSTHTSIEIGLFLARLGLLVAVCEMHDCNTFEYIEKYTSNFKSGKLGSVKIGSVDFFKYNLCEMNCIFNAGYQYIIMDFGSDFFENKYLYELQRANIKILVGGAKDWNLHNIEKILRKLGNEKDRFLYFFTFSSQELFKRASKALLFFGLVAYVMPYNPDPFEKDQKTDDLLKDSLKKILPIILIKKSFIIEFIKKIISFLKR